MAARIVVIDNDVEMRATLSTGLGTQGYQVWGYTYTQMGIAGLGSLHPDFIVLDFTSRDGGIGWELLQSLKMNDATATIPIIITSTVIELSAEIRGYLLTRYIQVVYKPVDLDILFPLIQTTLHLATQADTILSSQRPLPILIVEDTEELGDALATILVMEGYQVIIVGNGKLALDAVYHADHCLILLDIQMPIMNGLEFLKLYESQLRPHSPVVILSAEIDALTESYPAFVVDMITKPYKVTRLLPVVRKYALLA